MAMAHRPLGEVLLLQRLPKPDLGRLPVGDFLVGYDQPTPGRRAVADRARSPFASRLPVLIASSAQHDLLLEPERTTDAPWRQGLRGERTFDGRVWHDVRGIGGLHAGTGIEAFAALTKRPGCEATLGHTRFELYRRDLALHDFIAGIVDLDPLARPDAHGPRDGRERCGFRPARARRLPAGGHRGVRRAAGLPGRRGARRPADQL